MNNVTKKQKAIETTLTEGLNEQYPDSWHHAIDDKVEEITQHMEKRRSNFCKTSKRL